LPGVWEKFNTDGTVFGSINRAQLQSLPVPSIRVGSEEALETRLKPLEQRIMSSLHENSLLAELRDTLLPHLMSGRLRVKDAERQVEAAV
jgi:type I restriction enzyme S subunit